MHFISVRLNTFYLLGKPAIEIWSKFFSLFHSSYELATGTLLILVTGEHPFIFKTSPFIRNPVCNTVSVQNKKETDMGSLNSTLFCAPLHFLDFDHF